MYWTYIFSRAAAEASSDDHVKTEAMFAAQPIIRHIPPDNEFFDAGNIEREVLAKRWTLDPVADRIKADQNASRQDWIVCHVQTCREEFGSTAAYELHYQSQHKHVCATCGAVFATRRHLDLHVMEVHDAYFKILSERQPMYECLVDDCGRKFKDRRARKFHLVDFHKFSKFFTFDRPKQHAKPRRRRGQGKPKQPHAADDYDSMDVDASATEERPGRVLGAAHQDGRALIDVAARPEADHADAAMDTEEEVKGVAARPTHHSQSQTQPSRPRIPKKITFGRGRRHAGFR